ncbi:hypothetical protein F4677DRAFT_404340 [Hypoxylon crocopeplum]|nr:hypothetical protein F4677DRAFT_404340 [Hypoxylon crocopeplum]
MMQHAGRKRRVSTCVPCYTRKQKCNRQYPCNQCTRRRRPEECVYSSPRARVPPGTAQPQSQNLENEEPPEPTTVQEGGEASTSPYGAEVRPYGQHSSLAKSFGYFEDSKSNTMALLRECDLNDEGDADVSDNGPTSYIFETLRRDLERMPHRQVLDFLIQYFVSELNWMKQVVHAPSFLTQYQQWWAKDRSLSASDAEFAVLILQICSYATLFLPSPSHTVSDIRGLSLSDVRKTCSEVGDSLSKTCVILDWKGSLTRVQHILFTALKFSCEGRTDKFWEGIACASRAAQKAGIHTDSPTSRYDGIQELGKEMRRRTLCSLYILDSHLARQLDRVPFLPDTVVAETLLRLRLVPTPDASDISIDIGAPEIFTERLLQAQLGRFWRSCGPRQNLEHDPTQGEQRYERFCTEFIPILSPAFALEPDTKWDEFNPKLAMQRALLHIAIYDSVCWNFRPLLLLKPSGVARLPPYKQVLIQSQKKRLAMAALKELEVVSTLHSLFGNSYTRFSAIIFNTFEAAILLLCLCLHADFPFDQGEGSVDILGLKVGKLTRAKSMQAAEQALRRLQMLAEVSDMAASGARVMAQLFAKASMAKESTNSAAMLESGHGSTSWATTFSNLVEHNDDPGQWAASEHWNLSLGSDLLSTIVHENAYPESQIPPIDFTIPQSVGDPW